VTGPSTKGGCDEGKSAVGRIAERLAERVGFRRITGRNFRPAAGFYRDTSLRVGTKPSHQRSAPRAYDRARPELENSARGVFAMRKPERLDVSEVGDVTVVRLRDQRITEDRKIDQLAQELYDLVDGKDRRKLLVSLCSVDFLSSAALGKLITLDKKTMARGGLLKLSNVCPDLSQVFSVTRLDRLFDIEKDEAHALAAFQATPA